MYAQIVKDDDIVSNSNLSDDSLNNNFGEVLEFTFGKIIIDTTGEVYYESYKNATFFGQSATLSSETVLGNALTFSTKVYQTGPNSFEFNGYKLNYSNIKSAYSVYLGNGAAHEYVILLDNSGNVYALEFKITNGEYDLVNQSSLSQYKNIVSVVPTMSFGGHGALLIDKEGNLIMLAID